MNKKFVAVSILFFLLICSAGCSCNNTVFKGWVMGDYDMTTGEKNKNIIYEGTKSYAGEKTDHNFNYTPTAVYTSRTEKGILIDELFHDQSDMYLNSEHSAEDEVVIKFRAAKGNLDGVNVLVREYEQVKGYQSVEMKLVSSDSYCDYYEAKLSPSAAKRWYIFEVKKGNASIYYTAGLVKTVMPTKSDSNWFILTPGYKTPEWAQGTTYYSIFADSFFNGDPLTDADLGSHAASVARPWGTSRIGYQYPAIVSTTGADYYGGDLAGIRDKLSYLKNSLGIGTIYTNPITESTFNVGYGHTDYQTVSRFYGTNLELAKLTDLLHENEMRFITDGVWLYSASNSKEMNMNGYWPENGAYQSEDSIYSDMFYIEKNSSWPNYRTVYGPSVYKINFSTEFTKNYIIGNRNSALLYFMQEPFNIDGWRLDVPAYNESSTNGYEEMKLMREAMKSLNPDSVLIGETTVLPEELHGDALDSLWNYYNFGGSIYPYFGAQRMIPADTKVPSGDYNGEKYTETQFLERYASAVNARPFTASKAMYNSLSSHDIFRVMTNLEGNVDHVKMAISMQMTFTGSPSIYYGDEIGMTGESNSFGNMQYFDWNTKNWNYDVLNTYKSFASLRSEFKEELSQGGFMILNANDSARVYSYARFTESSAVIMAGNSSDKVQYVEIPVYKLGSFEDGRKLYDYSSGKAYEIKNGRIVAEVMPSSYAVIVPENTQGGFVGKYVSADIGSVPKTGAAWKAGGKITLLGSGFLEDVNDNFRLFAENAFGAFSVTVKIGDLNSLQNAGLTVRETDSTYSRHFSLTAENGKLKIRYRASEGGALETSEVSYSGNAKYFRIIRDNSGSFFAYASADGEKFDLLGEAYVPMQEQVLAGVFIAPGENVKTAVFEELTVEKGETLYFDSFDGGLSPIYAVLPADGLYTAENGVLTLRSETAVSRLLTAPNTGDVSVSVTLLESEAKQGLVIYQGENNNISLYRDGDKLFLKSVLSGLNATEATAEVKSEKVYLHLQKAGLYVSAYYSENGTDWKQLGGFIDANFSEIFAGMQVLGHGVGQFADFTVGNFINGKNDFVANRDMSVNDFKIAESSSYSIVYGEGEWSYTEGGFRQSSEKGYANCDFTCMFVADKFYFDTTLKGEGGRGMAGISFGKKKKSDRADESGYFMALKANGQAVLYFDGEVIAENKNAGLNFKSDNRIRIIAEAGGSIRVYINDAPDPVLICDTPSETVVGRMELVTIDASAAFTNTNIKPVVSGFESHSISAFKVSNGNLRSNYSDYGLSAGENGRVYEDFTLKTRFIVSDAADENSCLGFNIHAQTAEYPEKSGYMVFFTKDTVGIMMKGEKLAENHVDGALSGEVEAEISVKDNRVTVKAGNKTVLDYTVSGGPGVGAVDYTLINTQATLYDFTITPE